LSAGRGARRTAVVVAAAAATKKIQQLRHRRQAQQQQHQEVQYRDRRLTNRCGIDGARGKRLRARDFMATDRIWASNMRMGVRACRTVE